MESFESFVLSRDFTTVDAFDGWKGVEMGLMWPADLSDEQVVNRTQDRLLSAVE